MACGVLRGCGLQPPLPGFEKMRLERRTCARDRWSVGNTIRAISIIRHLCTHARRAADCNEERISTLGLWLAIAILSSDSKGSELPDRCNAQSATRNLTLLRARYGRHLLARSAPFLQRCPGAPFPGRPNISDVLLHEFHCEFHPQCVVSHY